MSGVVYGYGKGLIKEVLKRKNGMIDYVNVVKIKVFECKQSAEAQS